MTNDPPKPKAELHGDNIVDLSNHLKPLDVSMLSANDQDFLHRILEKIEDHLTEAEATRLAEIATQMEREELSALALPLERPTIEDPWDFVKLTEAYLELADAYEDLFELPPEEESDGELPEDAAE